MVCGGRAVKYGAKSLGQQAAPGRSPNVKASSHFMHRVVRLPHGSTHQSSHQKHFLVSVFGFYSQSFSRSRATKATG